MPRLFGGAWLVRSESEARDVTGQLGPDALDLDADEVCWQVEVHPATTCADLDEGTWDALADAIGGVLDVGIDVGQVPHRDGFLNDVRDDEDPHCPRCGTALRRDTIAGRTTWWCPEDQPPR